MNNFSRNSVYFAGPKPLSWKEFDEFLCGNDVTIENMKKFDPKTLKYMGFSIIIKENFILN
jgi:hypothetical protein